MINTLKFFRNSTKLIFVVEIVNSIKKSIMLLLQIRNVPPLIQCKLLKCFTHRYLGWKIIVHDSCDLKTAESEHYFYIDSPKEHFEGSPSIIHESRIQFTESSKPATDDNRHRFVDQIEHPANLIEQQLPKFNFNPQQNRRLPTFQFQVIVSCILFIPISP